MPISIDDRPGLLPGEDDRPARYDDHPRDGWGVDLARLLGCGILDYNHVTGGATVSWADLGRALLAGTVTPASVWVDGRTLHAAAWLANGPDGKPWRIVASTVATTDTHLRFAPHVGGAR